MANKKILLSTIKPNPDNPRVIKDNKFESLCKSIKEFPEMMELRPIIVDKKGVILGGNMRYEALKHLDYKEVPESWIKRAAQLTAKQKKEFIIKDNVGFGEWNWDILANEWDTDELIDWGLDLPDFMTEEPDATEDDYEIPDEIKTDIVLGDLFEIGEHRLLCGDSTDSDQVAKLMNGERADMVFADPPYNIGYEYNEYKDKKDKAEYAEFCYKWFGNLPECPKIITPGTQNIKLWTTFLSEFAFGVWWKKNGHSGSRVAHLNNWEPIIFYGKNKRERNSDVFEHHVESGFLRDN